MFWINTLVIGGSLIAIPMILGRAIMSAFKPPKDQVVKPPRPLTKEEKVGEHLAKFWENLGVVSNLPFNDEELEGAGEKEKEKLAWKVDEVLK